MHPALIVAALGYFVDVLDIWLYGVYRLVSLTDLGYSGEALAHHSTTILNAQMIGMLLGGLVFGVLGDKRGRKTAMFGSILIYAFATLFNAFVWDATSYTIARAIAGFGLAGELGAGVTLTMEMMKRSHRGWAPTLISAFGLLGCVAAALLSELVSWRIGYAIGGILGFLLFLLRLRVLESNMFVASQASGLRHGSLWDLVRQRGRFSRYILCILAGAPIWFVAGILLTFAPEFAVQLKVQETITVSEVTIFYALAIATGDIVAGFISQKIQSRRWVMFGFLVVVGLGGWYFLSHTGFSRQEFYMLYAVMGFAAGYWAVLMATIAEQFGTNLRATAATSAPNFIRGSVVVMTTALAWLKPVHGMVGSSAMIGGTVVAAGLLAILLLPETFDKDMDFYEQ